MKHPDRELNAHLLCGWSTERQIELPGNQVELLLDHLAWVLATNEHVNLTSVTDPAEALRLHVLDSLLASPEINDAPTGAMIDIGTGGGFPGVPLAIVSGRETVLLDSIRKKAEALSRFLEDRVPGCSVVAMRSEEYAGHMDKPFAVVVARAVAPLPVLVELAAPLLVLGGRLICLKGRPEENEVRRGAIAGEMVGLAELTRRETVLPVGDESRTIIVYEKVASSTVDLPRRPGRAQKRPLA